MQTDELSSSNDPLLQTFTLKHLTLKNRIMSTSHACGLDENGFTGDAYQAYHEEKARGGLALTMFGGSASVAPDSLWPAGQVNVSTDGIIPLFEQFTAKIHRHGCALMCQISHLGRRAECYAGEWLPAIGPSPIRETLHRSFPKAMDRHDIDRVVKAYGAAARRCRDGGLDGIETLGSGHLIGQFLSPYTNHRKDEFGGSLENRCRFGLMVYEEIRRQVGADFVVGFRFVIDEKGGDHLDFEDCLRIADLFESSGLIDFFNAIYGNVDTEIALAVDNMPGMASPIAPWLKRVGEFKQHVGLPVFHAARITDIATARYAITENLLDMVAMTRAHIADPQIVNKLVSGQEDRIRPCVGATHCMSANRPTCLHNPATGRELKLPQVITPSVQGNRRVVVVGAGPAGLEAARVSAERGHQVILFEASNQPGGQVIIATSSSWRGDLAGVIDWRVSETARLGVDLRLNTLAGVTEVTAERPDVVIIATGGLPDMGFVEGGELCTSSWDLLTGQVSIESDVIVYDGTGRHVGPLCADMIASAGCAATLVGIDGLLAPELVYSERVVWRRQIFELGVDTLFDHRLTSVSREDEGLRVCFTCELNESETIHYTEQVVVEVGTQPADELYQQLRPDSINDGVTDIDALLSGSPQVAGTTTDTTFELHRIGDAVASRNIAAAMLDALRLCAVM